MFYYGNATQHDINSVYETMYVVMWFYQMYHLLQAYVYIDLYHFDDKLEKEFPNSDTQL